MVKPRCCVDIWHPHGYSRCANNTKVERDGKGYCGTHDPERLKAIRAASNARWTAEKEVAAAKIVARENEARNAARWRKSQELFYSTFLQIGSQTIQFEMPSDLTDYLDAAIEHDRACHAPKD